MVVVEVVTAVCDGVGCWVLGVLVTVVVVAARKAAVSAKIRAVHCSRGGNGEGSAGERGGELQETTTRTPLIPAKKTHTQRKHKKASINQPISQIKLGSAGERGGVQFQETTTRTPLIPEKTHTTTKTQNSINQSISQIKSIKTSHPCCRRGQRIAGTAAPPCRLIPYLV